jgi:hypothetical protein
MSTEFGALLDEVMGGAQGVYDASGLDVVVGTVSGAVAGGVDQASAAVGAVFDTFSDVAGEFQAAVLTAAQPVFDAAGDLVDGVQSAVGPFAQEIEAIYDAAGERMAALTAALDGEGAEAMAGAGRVMAEADAAAARAVRSLQDGLGNGIGAAFNPFEVCGLAGPGPAVATDHGVVSTWFPSGRTETADLVGLSQRVVGAVSAVRQAGQGRDQRLLAVLGQAGQWSRRIGARTVPLTAQEPLFIAMDRSPQGSLGTPVHATVWARQSFFGGNGERPAPDGQRDTLKPLEMRVLDHRRQVSGVEAATAGLRTALIEAHSAARSVTVAEQLTRAAERASSEQAQWAVFAQCQTAVLEEWMMLRALLAARVRLRAALAVAAMPREAPLSVAA